MDLVTDRLRLRVPSAADVDALHAIVGDPETMKYWAPGRDRTRLATSQRIDGMLAHWQTHGFGDRVIIELSSGLLVGFCGIHFVPGRALPNLGYVVERGCWGRGIATEAARASVQSASSATLKRIEAVAYTENPASRRVLEKCGMRFVEFIYEFKGRRYVKPWAVYELELDS